MGWPEPGHCLTSIIARLCAPSHNLQREVPLHRRRRTALLLTAAIAAAAPLLTACGNDAHPGAAAVVGGERITVSQLENRVDEVRAGRRRERHPQGGPADAVRPGAADRRRRGAGGGLAAAVRHPAAAPRRQL